MLWAGGDSKVRSGFRPALPLLSRRKSLEQETFDLWLLLSNRSRAHLRRVLLHARLRVLALTSSSSSCSDVGDVNCSCPGILKGPFTRGLNRAGSKKDRMWRSFTLKSKQNTKHTTWIFSILVFQNEYRFKKRRVSNAYYYYYYMSNIICRFCSVDFNFNQKYMLNIPTMLILYVFFGIRE